nr:Polypeptide N-acetylgalactosaminyltransferase 35A [Ipomoea batatas]
MVCLACLLPLFLVPIVNLLPLLFDFIMAKVYRLFGKEYQKPARVPPACPYKRFGIIMIMELGWFPLRSPSSSLAYSSGRIILVFITLEARALVI